MLVDGKGLWKGGLESSNGGKFGAYDVEEILIATAHRFKNDGGVFDHLIIHTKNHPCKGTLRNTGNSGYI
jgi:hypothetical protein